MIGELHRVSSVEALHASAAAMFVSSAVQAVSVHGTFAVALAGGTTPRGVYARLAEDATLRSQVPWDNVHFFWGDERHVAPDHPDSNFRMAREAMLDRLAIDPTHVWRIKGEYESASEAADAYEHDLRQFFRVGRTGEAGAVGEQGLPAADVPRFDLVLLGLGPDGHTASLFPGTDALREQRRFAVSNWVAKLESQRITLTAPVLNNAADVLFLVHGTDKAEALKAVLEGPYQPEHLPAQLIRPARGRLRWLVDQTAAHLLTAVDPEST
jgi:6-phosphogluconolactonase